MGGSEGIWGGAVVTDSGGSYAGERGRARRGLEAGERREGAMGRVGESGCAADPLSAAAAERGPAVLMLSLRAR